jgi:hypothetical protein
MKASDNEFPSVLFKEQSTPPANPATSDRRLFFNSSDHALYAVDSTGAQAPIGNAPGDLLTVTVNGAGAILITKSQISVNGSSIIGRPFTVNGV